MDVVPSHTMCEMMRLISHAITRSTLQRGVISMRISWAAARAEGTAGPAPRRRRAGRASAGHGRPARGWRRRARSCACSFGVGYLPPVAPAQPLLHLLGELGERLGERQLLQRVMRFGVRGAGLPHLPGAATPAAQRKVLPYRRTFSVRPPNDDAADIGFTTE